MALKPTIYKARIDLSDLNRHVYDALNLTLAQHPSETVERMVVRLLAYCLNASDNLIFCKGLSDADEADLWAKNLNGGIELWIDVGEPAVDRIKKSARQAKTVKVYSFNSKSDTWWSQGKADYSALNAEYVQLPWEQVQALASRVNKTMAWSVTVSENSLYVATEDGEVELTCTRLTS